jgi:predicted nucleic acid-binding protein
MTASIALRHNLTLVTFNIKHFRSTPGLSTVQPYDRS